MAHKIPRSLRAIKHPPTTHFDLCCKKAMFLHIFRQSRKNFPPIYCVIKNSGAQVRNYISNLAAKSILSAIGQICPRIGVKRFELMGAVSHPLGRERSQPVFSIRHTLRLSNISARGDIARRRDVTWRVHVYPGARVDARAIGIRAPVIGMVIVRRSVRTVRGAVESEWSVEERAAISAIAACAKCKADATAAEVDGIRLDLRGPGHDRKAGAGS